MASASVSAAAVAGRKIFGSLRPLRRFPAGLVSRRIWPTDCVDGVGPRLVPDGLASSSSSRCFSAWRASSVTLKSDGDLDVAEVGLLSPPIFDQCEGNSRLMGKWVHSILHFSVKALLHAHSC